MRDRCRRDPLTGVAAETAATAWAALPDLATDIDGIDLAAAGAALSDGNTRDALMFFPPGPDPTPAPPAVGGRDRPILVGRLPRPAHPARTGAGGVPGHSGQPGRRHPGGDGDYGRLRRQQRP